MADIYVPGEIPAEYEATFFAGELRRVSAQLHEMELPYMQLIVQHVAPAKVFEGMLLKADGTDWNPGHGAGVYVYQESGWKPLFTLHQGTVTSQTLVENTVTETEIYTTDLAINSFHTGDITHMKLGGSYDTGAASDTWTLRIKVAGTTVHTIVRPSTNNVTDAGWHLHYQLTIRTAGASGTLVDFAILHDDDSVKTVSEATTHSIDTTVINALSVTVQWGVAKVANIFRIDQGIVTHDHG